MTETVGGYGGEGCPTAYRGATLSWQNKLLGKFVKNGATTNYEYKSDNVRLRKSGSVAAEFSYDGSLNNPVVQSVGNDVFDNDGDWSKVNWAKATVIGVTSGVISWFGKGVRNLTKLPKYDEYVQDRSAAVKGLMFVANVSRKIISALTAGLRSAAKGISNSIF